MLPAEMAHIADRTRAREEEEDGEEDPSVQPEIILPQGTVIDCSRTKMTIPAPHSH